jgi:hypothetical protein
MAGSHNPYDELAAVLHLLTPDELKLAELLLSPSPDAFVRSLPTDVLLALLLVGEQLALYRGAAPADGVGGAKDEAVIFDPETGAPLPYAVWRRRSTGQVLSDAERLGMGPLAASVPDDTPLVTDEILSLLPDGMRLQVAEAARGYWPGV